MERSVEVLAVIFFGVIGLSHLLQPEAWVEYFVLLRSKGRPGALAGAALVGLAALLGYGVYRG